MRTLLTIVFIVSVMCVVCSSAQTQFSMYGFSYFTPPEGLGTVTTVVGRLEPPVGFSYPISLNFTVNEYTFYFQTAITSVTPGPLTSTYSYADATFFIYEDPSKNSNYGTSPPNATSPSTFRDGTVILSGTLSELTRLNYNMGFPEPSVVGECEFTGGTRFGDLTVKSWTYHGGLSSNPLLGIPFGYRHRWATKMVPAPTVPVEETTWGALKNLYDDR
jgi:hypothetical protein